MTPAHRVNVSIPEVAYQLLCEQAKRDGVLVGSLARELLVDQIRPPQPPGRLPTSAAATASWLQPWDATASQRAAWRAELWRRVVALVRRYPKYLANLEAGFHTHAHRVETLGALVEWRAELDAGEHIDPRNELAFQGSLQDLARLLKLENPGADVSGTALDPDQPPPSSFRRRALRTQGAKAAQASPPTPR